MDDEQTTNMSITSMHQSTEVRIFTDMTFQLI